MIKIFLIAGCLFNSQFVFATRTNFDVEVKFRTVLSKGLSDVNTGLQPINPFASINQGQTQLTYLNRILNTTSEESSGSFSEPDAAQRNLRINQEYWNIGNLLTNCLKKDWNGSPRMNYPDINTWYTIGAWASFTAGKVIASKVDILQVDATCEETKNGKKVNYCFSDKMNHEVTKAFCHVVNSASEVRRCFVPKGPAEGVDTLGTETVELMINKNYLNSKIILQEAQNLVHPIVNGTASALVNTKVRRWFAAGNFILASELIPIGRHFLQEFCSDEFGSLTNEQKESKSNSFLQALKNAENKATPGHHGKFYLYDGFKKLLEAKKSTEVEKFINAVAESNVYIGYSEQSRLQKILEKALPLSLTEEVNCILGDAKCSELATYLAGFTFGSDQRTILMANGFTNLKDKVDPLMKKKFPDSCQTSVVLTDWSNFNQRMSYLRYFFYAFTVTNPNNSSSFLNKITDAPPAPYEFRHEGIYDYP